MRPDPATVKCRQCSETGHFPLQCPTKKDRQKVAYVQWLDNEEEENYKDKEDDAYNNMFVGTITHKSYHSCFNADVYDEDSDDNDRHAAMADQPTDDQMIAMAGQPADKRVIKIFDEDSDEDEGYQPLIE